MSSGAGKKTNGVSDFFLHRGSRLAVFSVAVVTENLTQKRPSNAYGYRQ